MASAKESKGPGPAEEGGAEKPVTQAPPAAANASSTVAKNTKQRAASVVKRLKLSAPVAAGVLAHHGLTKASMVVPSEFETQVAAWLAAPVSN